MIRLSSCICVWVLLALTSSTFGCSAVSSCDTSNEGNPPDPYHDGATVDGYYMSSDWSGPLLPFTAGKRYELYHGLGCTPAHLSCMVSFSAEGIVNGSIAQSAGNLCIIQHVDEELIRVQNDTCSDMYVLVTASGCTGASLDAGNDSAKVSSQGIEVSTEVDRT